MEANIKKIMVTGQVIESSTCAGADRIADCRNGATQP